MKINFILILFTCIFFLFGIQQSYGEGPLYSGEGQHSLWFNYSSWIQLPLELNQELGREFTFECWFQVGPVADTRNNPNPGDWGSAYTITVPENFQTTFDKTGLINWTNYYNLSGVDLNNTATRTISYSALNRPLVSRWRNVIPPVDNAYNDFDLQINPEGLLQFFMGGGLEERNLGVFVEAAEPMESNRWYHVSVTVLYSPLAIDELPQSAILILDHDWDNAHVTDFQFSNWRTFGEGTIPYDAQRQYLLDEPIYIGRYQNNDEFWPNGQYFVGMLDEIRFWRGVRLDTEVELYLNRSISGDEPWLKPPGLTGKPGYFPGEPNSRATLVAAYNLNEGNGNIARDQGPNGFHGIITNPMWRNSEVYIIQYYYLLKDVTLSPPLPLLDIPLFAAGGSPNPKYNFTISFVQSELRGFLFYNDSLVSNGQTFQGDESELVFKYQFNGTNSGVYKFFYLVDDGTQQGWLNYPERRTEVRIIVDLCVDGGDSIDLCGICNGRNRTVDCFGICNGTAVLDACGVCNGTNSTCLGCDGVPNSGLRFDACGVCNGTNSTCLGCDGIPNSGKVVDICGICGGLNRTLDACGVCNGTNATCAGCDGVPFSNKTYDLCGVCGGNNTCLGCDGIPFSNKTYDICGVCGGSNSTCGGCDDHGGKIDACGICNGDNSTCQCVFYNGYKVTELDYLLFSYTTDQISFKVDHIQDLLLLILEDLQYYSGPGDLGVMIKYFNNFCVECLDNYNDFLDEFIGYLHMRRSSLPSSAVPL